MKLTTPVEINKSEKLITYKDKIFLIGSCFADNIGGLLNHYKFDVMVNPFGTLYNPVSIANSLERIVNGKKFKYEEVIKCGELYNSFSHHTSFASKSPKLFLAKANKSLIAAKTFLDEASVVIITLGTAWCFRHVEKDIIVSNCNKIKASEFRRELLNVDEVEEQINKIESLLKGKQIIYTISPIRHFKDGAHGNQISKSTLLLGTQNVKNYFPSYEIMLDELRDYRFYAEDMIHPSDLAVKYIFEKFKDNYILPDTFPLMSLGEKITLAEQHRPFNPKSVEYQKFLIKIDNLKKEFYKKRG